MEIRTIAVIGAGAMGRAVAYEALAAGYSVILEDVLPERLAAAQQEVRGRLNGTGSNAAATAQLTSASSVDQACRAAELVIETLPEEVEMKIDVFCILEKFARPGAILATNARTIPVTEIAAVTTRGEECVGLRFIETEREKKALEIVRGAGTSDATVEACREMGRRMGREIEVVREPAGPAVGSAGR